MSNEQGIYIYDDGWKTVSKEEKLQTVNKKQPDTEGNVQLSKSDIGLSNVDNTKQATKAEFDTHVKDTVKHITAQERTDWNAKETTTGAQAKATKAEENAKKASLPLTGGVISGGNLVMDGGSVIYARPDTTGGWARGFYWNNIDQVTRLGGIGVLGLGDKVAKFYIGFGSDPWLTPVVDINPNMVKIRGKIETNQTLSTDSEDTLTTKKYVDLKISGIPEVDISGLETKTDAKAKLTEAKEYTDEEIAKIPDVKNTVNTVKNYEQSIYVEDGYLAMVNIGKHVKATRINNYMQFGDSPYQFNDDATGSVNISSLSDDPEGNSIYHRNAMVFGNGIETLSKSNQPFYKESSATYIGQYNQQPTDKYTRFLVGIGNRYNEKKTGMRMGDDGHLMINGQYKTSGADYAEMFEWEDKNPENIDRVALAVTWGEGESIKLANSGDEIIGIVSATAAVLGDNPDEWDKRFVTDQFGRPLRKEYTEINEDGEEETYEWFVENPEYDKDTPYISRSERPEWSAIGLVGKLYWIDDGTLEVGDYATVSSNGVATKGTKENGYRVMKRISKNVDGNSGVVKVFFK